MPTDPTTRLVRAADECAHAVQPESELGGLLARPWSYDGIFIRNRHQHCLLYVEGESDAERDRIAALVLATVNPPLSEKGNDDG